MTSLNVIAVLQLLFMVAGTYYLQFLDFEAEFYVQILYNMRFSVSGFWSVPWVLAEFYFNRGLQRLYTGTCIILQKQLTGFFVCLKVKHIS